MNTIKILCIGNSYSVGATNHLHQIAQNRGDSIDVCNLYIGGCSLQRHYDCMKENIPDYRIFRNGCWIGLPNVRIADYIDVEKWDYITLQQVSGLSFKPETFQPYLSELANYAQKHNPNAKLLWHQTQVCSEARCKFEFKLSGKSEMYQKLTESANYAAEQIGACGILATGDAIMTASQKYGVIDNLIYADPGSHLGTRYGEYAAALTWYSQLTGNDVSQDTYQINGADENISKLMRLSAQEAADKYRF